MAITNQRLWNAVHSLDFKGVRTWLKNRLGWEEGRVNDAILLYCRFLYLVALYPDTPLVPTLEIDEVWHAHILSSTSLYAKHCLALLGYFLDHEYYASSDDLFGVSVDLSTDPRFVETARRYRDVFGEEYGSAPQNQSTEALISHERSVIDRAFKDGIPYDIL